MKTVSCAAVLALMLAGLVGCRTTGVMNLSDRPTTAVDGSALPIAEVEQAILEGMTVRGWRVRERNSGKIVAELNVRQHQATIEIAYDARNYDINYLDSSGLRADDGEIHRNYNRWVKNLDADIQRKLAKIEVAR